MQGSQGGLILGSPKFQPLGESEVLFCRGKRIPYSHRQAPLTPGQTSASLRRDTPSSRPAVGAALWATAWITPAGISPAPTHPLSMDNTVLRALARIQLLLIYIFPWLQTTLFAIEGYPGMLKTCPDCRVNGHVVLGSDGMALGGALMGLSSHQGYPTSLLCPY